MTMYSNVLNYPIYCTPDIYYTKRISSKLCCAILFFISQSTSMPTLNLYQSLSIYIPISASILLLYLSLSLLLSISISIYTSILISHSVYKYISVSYCPYLYIFLLVFLYLGLSLFLYTLFPSYLYLYICFYIDIFTSAYWPTQPDDPWGIRVASAIEFSVCLSVCSLWVTDFLILL